MKTVLQNTAIFFLVIFSAVFVHGQDAPSKLQSNFEHQGLQREYIYYAPKNLNKDAALVVVLHGFTSSAQKIMAYSKFNALANEHQFAVLYPQGTIDANGNTFWNVGYDFHKNSKVDDVDFIVSLTQQIQKKHGLSAHNTFITGMSNGGEMTYLLLCKHPEIFKAGAPVAGMMMPHFFEYANTSITRSVLAVFGTKDAITNYNGDPNNKDGWGAYISIPETIAYWAQQIDYDKVVTNTLPDVVKDDQSFVETTRYLNTTTQKEILFYKIVEGGHEWPGAWGNKDVDISVEIWGFFEKYIN